MALEENMDMEISETGVFEVVDMASKYFDRILMHLKTHLYHIVSQYSSYSRRCVKSALAGLLVLSGDFVNILLRCDGIDDTVEKLQLRLITGCELYLKAIFKLTTSITVVPTALHCVKNQVLLPELLITWLAVLNDPNEEVQSPHDHEGDVSESLLSLPTSIQRRAHLFIILPLLISLVCSSSHSNLNEIAMQIIEVAPTGQLLPLISSLVRDLVDSKMLNKRLENEVRELVAIVLSRAFITPRLFLFRL